MSKNFLTPIILPAGTSSNAPLKLQSGTNLTTVAAGAVEYDGKVIYSTPAARGISPSMMFYRLNSDLPGTQAITNQSVFGVKATLASNTVYAFEINFTCSKIAGAGTHSFTFGYDGTATVNNFFQCGFESRAVNGPILYTFDIVGFSSVSVSSSFTANTINNTAYVRHYKTSGTISVDVAGTFAPYYKLSAAPGGVWSTHAGSYISIWPIGAAGSDTSVGPWA